MMQKGANKMLKKAQTIWRPKTVLLILAMMMMMGIVSSVAAAPEGQPFGTERTHELFSEKMASPSVIIMHYDANGHPTGRLHYLTIDEYYAIIDALLTSGYPLSPQNVDCMGHRMRGDDCPLWP